MCLFVVHAHAGGGSCACVGESVCVSKHMWLYQIVRVCAGVLS